VFAADETFRVGRWLRAVYLTVEWLARYNVCSATSLTIRRLLSPVASLATSASATMYCQRLAFATSARSRLVTISRSISSAVRRYSFRFLHDLTNAAVCRSQVLQPASVGSLFGCAHCLVASDHVLTGAHVRARTDFRPALIGRPRVRHTFDPAPSMRAGPISDNTDD